MSVCKLFGDVWGCLGNEHGELSGYNLLPVRQKSARSVSSQEGVRLHARTTKSTMPSKVVRVGWGQEQMWVWIKFLSQSSKIF